MATPPERHQSLTIRPEDRAVEIQLRGFLWKGIGGGTDDKHTMDWWLPLRLPTVGTWTIRDVSPDGSASITLEVNDAPSRPCLDNSEGACEMDCDCSYGLVCLGGNESECHRPCENDMDCIEGGLCSTSGSGIEHVCSTDEVTCVGPYDVDFWWSYYNDCSYGYSCDDGLCYPSTQPSQQTRHECECSDDCSPPLRCVEPSDPEGTRRCEIPCQTDSPLWCGSGHVPGEPEQDVSSLAEVGSVCVWIGE